MGIDSQSRNGVDPVNRLSRPRGEWPKVRQDAAFINEECLESRYQAFRRHPYFIPSDELQFESYEAGHVVDLILNSHKENPLFDPRWAATEKPGFGFWISGRGKGTWALDVADRFPNGTVRGVDLYPPPVDWTPPNCILEVDDILEEWTWREKFDLIHMRSLLGSFDPAEWTKVYQQCYDKLQPGGWIEQMEVGPFVESDDDTLPADSALASWGTVIKECGERAGRSCDVIFTMASSIRASGFVDVHEKVYKMPIGPWPKDPRLKEAGRLNYDQWMSGMEGWVMWLLTKHGAPKPWTKEAVYVYCAKVRNEINNANYHAYHKARRVWARKPFPGEVVSGSHRDRSPTSPQDSSQPRAQSVSGSPPLKAGELSSRDDEKQKSASPEGAQP
ncbi:hypothetical protein N7468_010788 [Penicillium chermesinum]|uniref:Uncharacterized protein n=1 Tax=Penicillium chermesinum TaxID=63820 RepID=A0A9W9N9Z5_9EURO|nr:uncharacterized protein N7468_010788 [Penicillium chermesinum]KAJ5215109.1 hypothetical protein N7468_010788 [Penicillium chermesinum]